MPPPSRPRYNPDNVHDIYPTRNASPTNFGHYVPEQKPQSPHQNHIIHNPYNNNQQSTGVPQLSVQYIANFGNKYYAIVPANFKGVDNYPKYNALKPYYLKHDLYEKPNGKYNFKLKKYKAYETKQKHVPYYTVSNYVFLLFYVLTWSGANWTLAKNNPKIYLARQTAKGDI